MLNGHVRGSCCRAYTNDLKVKIQAARSFYYPDIIVTCEPFEPKSVFCDAPVLLVEVLSPSTAQIDKREKLVAYQKIASLKEYVIVHQDRQLIELYLRESAERWRCKVLGRGEDLVLESLPKGPLRAPFATIYEGYDPPSWVKENDGLYETQLGSLSISSGLPNACNPQALKMPGR